MTLDLSTPYRSGTQVASVFWTMDVSTLATVANLLSVARRLTRAQAGTVYCCEADGLHFLVTQNDELAGSLGHPQAVDLLSRAPLPWTQHSIAVYVAIAGTLLNIPDAYHIPRTKPYAFNSRVDAMTGFRTRSMLVLPLHAPVRGVLQLINATNDTGEIVPFSHAEEILVEELAAGATTTACTLSSSA